jgi:hypothetical protein
MTRFKLTVLAAAATTVLACAPLTPAAAAGPLLAAPWAVGHLFRAATALATLPLVVASGAAPQPAAPYFAARGSYYAPPAYYSPYGYYPPAGAYYPPPAHYYPAPAYRPAAYPYAGPLRGFQQSARGYYAPGMRYSEAYGGRVFSPSRGFSYRRR